MDNKEYARKYMKARRASETKEQKWMDDAYTKNAIANKRSKGNMEPEDQKALTALYYHLTAINSILKPYGQVYTLDHIQNLSEGGSHSLNNVQILSQSENAKKWHRERKEMCKRPSNPSDYETR